MKIKGFTLIELLIALTILAILAVIGLVTFSNVGKRTRDAKRVGDIEAIQKALEQYMQDNGKYPPTGTCAEASTYFQGAVPTGDTKTGSYTMACNPDSYCLCSSTLELTTGNSSSKANCNSWVSTGLYYCLKSMQ